MQKLDNIVVPEENHLERIDKFLTQSLEIDLSRSTVQRLIKTGNILVADTAIKQNYKIKTNDVITITIPEPEPLELEPEDIPLDIIFEDKDLAVLNKQPGLVVHPGPGNWSKTLVNGLLFHLKDLSSIGDKIRPGIVHRLDKDTTGLMIVAKNDLSHRYFVDAFANRTIHKTYNAIIVGKPKQTHEIINQPIARHKKYRHKMTITESGKEAITEYRIQKIFNTRFGIYTLLEINLHTGRTHQIRVHLSSMGNPIVGDPIYSKRWEKYRVPYLLLAATGLSFKHPKTGEQLSFSIDLPKHMRDYIQKLETHE